MSAATCQLIARLKEVMPQIDILSAIDMSAIRGGLKKDSAVYVFFDSRETTQAAYDKRVFKLAESWIVLVATKLELSAGEKEIIDAGGIADQVQMALAGHVMNGYITGVEFDGRARAEYVDRYIYIPMRITAERVLKATEAINK